MQVSLVQFDESGANRIEPAQERLDGQLGPNSIDSSPKDQGTLFPTFRTNIRRIYLYHFYPSTTYSDLNNSHSHS
jgi:hypothetical protein